MSGLRAERAAEVIVRRTDGGEERGSGYLARTGIVLTAEHVVRHAAGIEVRFEADRDGEWTASADRFWSDPETDVALLTLRPAPGAALRPVRPVRWGAVREADAGLPSSALGFPLFKMRDDPGGATRYRDSCHARGEIALLADRREKSLELRVQQPDRDPDPEQSPWAGMSGAAVWAYGRIIGIVTRHYRAEGLGTLTVSRADGWAQRADASAAAALRQVGLTTPLRPAVPRWRDRRVVLGMGAATIAAVAAGWLAVPTLTARPPLRFAVVGACAHIGQRLDSVSGGFTPGGTYTDEIVAPDGRDYALPPSEQKGTVARNGSLGWHWTCANGDPEGTYRARVTDEASHRQTGWVSFEVGRLAPYPCALHREDGLWFAGISSTRTAELGPGTGDANDVAEAQCLLQRLGFPLGSQGVDGQYGQYTQQAVMSLQLQGHLPVDGLIGPDTWRLLRTWTPPGG